MNPKMGKNLLVRFHGPRIMKYLIKGKFLEENTAGRDQEQIFTMIEMAVHPSLEMLEKNIQEKKVEGGVVAGAREGYFIVDVGSHQEVGSWLRSFPFWGMLEWTVIPLQSPQSTVDQDRAAFRRAREMRKETK
jgi:hypothetical protein